MKTYHVSRNLLRRICLKQAFVTLLLFSAQHVFSQTINTSQGTFVLVPPANLVDASAARSARAVAELAVAAVTNDTKKVMSEQKNLQPTIDSYTKDTKKYKDELDGYNQDLNAYNSRLEPYQEELARYNRDLEPHNAAVAANNALAPENRDPATYQQLVANKNRLDGWLADLNAKKAVLDNEVSVLDTKKGTLDKTYSDLSYRYGQWSAEQKTLDIKLGTAYQQLKQLHEYALEINKLLEKWQQPPIETTNLNTQLEQLKALSNKGWD